MVCVLGFALVTFESAGRDVLFRRLLRVAIWRTGQCVRNPQWHGSPALTMETAFPGRMHFGGNDRSSVVVAAELYKARSGRSVSGCGCSRRRQSALGVLHQKHSPSLPECTEGFAVRRMACVALIPLMIGICLSMRTMVCCFVQRRSSAMGGDGCSPDRVRCRRACWSFDPAGRTNE